jgi:hypothetical protein
MSEICRVCEIAKDNIFDGLCETCEILWDNEMLRLSKELPADTLLTKLFEITTIKAKEKYIMNHPKIYKSSNT